MFFKTESVRGNVSPTGFPFSGLTIDFASKYKCTKCMAVTLLCNGCALVTVKQRFTIKDNIVYTHFQTIMALFLTPLPNKNYLQVLLRIPKMKIQQ